MLGWLNKRASPTKPTNAPRRVLDASPYVVERNGMWVPSAVHISGFVQAHGDDADENLTALSRDWLNKLNADAFSGKLSTGESARFILLGDIAPTHGKNVLAFAEQTLDRFLADFGDIARFGPASKMPIIALSEQDDYYRLISAFFDEGTYGLSSGLFIHEGLSFFIFPNEDMWALEPVIAHELLHAVMFHLPLPAWVNEGLAVNAEFRYGNRYSDPRRRDDLIPHHRSYWNPARLQSFLRGALFSSASEGQELSYDLARQLVLGLSNDWTQMKQFIVSAQAEDFGERAANEHFGFSLAIALSVATGIPAHELAACVSHLSETIPDERARDEAANASERRGITPMSNETDTYASPLY
jgi:hypothetical protein